MTLRSTANDALQARWQSLSDWCTEGAMASRFRQQLAEATDWNPDDCERGIEEYRRFCLLASLRQGDVAPSKPVDEVWHLHLTYTRDYWGSFCTDRLQFPLHHQPALGRPGEAQTLRLVYVETLHAYAEQFGDPEPRWWPDSALTPLAPAPHPPRTRWLKPVGQWLIGSTLLAAGASQALAENPLDWRGPEFLKLYLVLLVIALVVSILLRAWLKRQDEPVSGMPGEPSLWELAWLAGGAGRLAETAVAELHRREWVTWNKPQRSLQIDPKAADGDPVLHTAITAIRQKPSPDLRGCIRSAAFANVGHSVQRRGWWFTPETARRIAWIAAAPGALLVAFGAAKIAVGLSRGKPVALLVVLTVLALVLTLTHALLRPKLTRRGRDALKLHLGKNQLKSRAPRSHDLPLAVALVGSSMLAGTALAGFHEARHPSSDGSSGDSSSSSDSSSCSSGDSSCGGGGCGGCGGD